MTEKLKVGDYVYDYNLDKDREVAVWTVRLEDTEVGESYFDCETQYEAEVLSRLIKLGHTKVKLEKVEKVQNKILERVENHLDRIIHPNLLRLIKTLIAHEFKELIEE